MTEQHGENSISRTSSNTPPNGRVAGIDFGTVRIGVALSDAGRMIASPHAVHTRQNLAADAQFFKLLVADEQVTLFVVGLPVHMSGDESEKSQEARAFGSWLQATTEVDVVFFDERFTTREANRFMDAAGLSSKQRKSRRDMIAAQILLATYLERGSDADPGAIE